MTDDLGWIPFLAEWIDPYLSRRDPEVAVAAYRLTMARDDPVRHDHASSAPTSTRATTSPR